jgi:hypothetical protein
MRVGFRMPDGILIPVTFEVFNDKKETLPMSQYEAKARHELVVSMNTIADRYKDMLDIHTLLQAASEAELITCEHVNTIEFDDRPKDKPIYACIN